MPRPRSIYEKQTTSVIPPPELRERSHVVEQGESLIGLANREYSLQEYDAGLWRGIAEQNKVTNPFTFDTDFLGVRIRIPARPLPDFT